MNAAGEARTWSEYEAQATSFLESVFAYTDQLKLNVDGLPIDHVGLRVPSNESVDKLRDELQALCGDPLSQNVVNGRVILVFKLPKPIPYKHKGKQCGIDCVELPYPKPDDPRDGIEHVEFVLDCRAHTVDDLTRAFHCRFGDVGGYEIDNPKLPPDCTPNPALVYKKDDMLTIKFHTAPIEKIVKK